MALQKYCKVPGLSKYVITSQVMTHKIYNFDQVYKVFLTEEDTQPEYFWIFFGENKAFIVYDHIYITIWGWAVPSSGQAGAS